MDQLYAIALRTIKQQKQAIVFCPSRASAEKTAEDIAKKVNFFEPELEKAILRALPNPTKQCRRLSHIVRKAIAFHHSGLTSKQKEIIEDNFRAGKIKIICATPTLAAGLSMPVFRVIVKSLKRFSGKWGMQYIPVLEYLQMAGRAGRPEYESFGEAITLAKSEKEKDEIYERYVCGEPEEIYSKLAVEPVLRMYLLSLISSRIIRDNEEMKEFFAKTFWAKQFQDMQKLEFIMEKMITKLQEWNFLEKPEKNKQEQGDFISANTIEKPTKQKYRATPLGRRVSELYLDPLTANHLLKGIEKIDEETTDFAIIQLIAYTLEMRPLLRIKKADRDKVDAALAEHEDTLITKIPKVFDIDYDEFLQSIKTASFFESWVQEASEDALLEVFDIRPGEIRAKIEIADWLLYACVELAKLQSQNNAHRLLHKMRIRVKNGVKEELLPLLKLKGVGRARARKLTKNNLKSIADLKRADVATIAQLLGPVLARQIKEQLGQAQEPVPKGKRVGQRSLEKYN